MPQPPSQTFRIGSQASIWGGLLCLVGYSLPWITFRIRVDGGVIVTSTFNGWRTLGADGLIFALPNLVPLLMGAVALAVGLRAWWRGAPPQSWRLYWVIAILGVLWLLFTIYSFDPFGLSSDTFWVLQREPPPLIDPGLYLMSLGAGGVVAGGLLMGRSREMGELELPAGARHADA